MSNRYELLDFSQIMSIPDIKERCRARDQREKQIKELFISAIYDAKMLPLSPFPIMHLFSKQECENLSSKHIIDVYILCYSPYT